MSQENLSKRDQYIETLQQLRRGLQGTKQKQINEIKEYFPDFVKQNGGGEQARLNKAKTNLLGYLRNIKEGHGTDNERVNFAIRDIENKI